MELSSNVRLKIDKRGKELIDKINSLPPEQRKVVIEMIKKRQAIRRLEHLARSRATK